MTSGPTVAVIITSLQNADTGKTTTSDGKFRQDFAKKRDEQIKRVTEP
jgi:hypothetical protein